MANVHNWGHQRLVVNTSTAQKPICYNYCIVLYCYVTNRKKIWCKERQKQTDKWVTQNKQQGHTTILALHIGLYGDIKFYDWPPSPPAVERTALSYGKTSHRNCNHICNSTITDPNVWTFLGRETRSLYLSHCSSQEFCHLTLPSAGKSLNSAN